MNRSRLLLPGLLVLATGLVLAAYFGLDGRPAALVAGKLLSAQHALRTDMAQLARAAQAGVSVSTMGILFGLSFAYGILHAVGPGHGKALSCAYMLHGKRRLSDGLLFGNALAFTHAASGVIAVLLIRFVLALRVSRAMAETTRLTSLLSFSLILLMGAALLVTGLKNALFPEEGKAAPPSRRGPVLTAVLLGLIPCPAVVTVMLLASGLKVLHLGLLMAAGIGTGMAVTLSSVVLFVVSGKRGAGVPDAATGSRIPGILSAVSGLLLILLSVTFLMALKAPPRLL